MPTNMNMYKRIKTRSDTTLLVGVLKSNYFPTRFRKQNQKRSGSGGTGSLKFFKTLLNESLGFIHI